MTTATHNNKPRHSVSVAGIVSNGHGQILAIRRRDNNQWQPPGGILELGETFEEGVQREVFEETGVHVCVERLTGVYKNVNLAVVALVFRCRAVSGTPRATDESREVRWLDVSEAIAVMPATFAIRVKDASLPSAAHRTHDGTTLFHPDSTIGRS